MSNKQEISSIDQAQLSYSWSNKLQVICSINFQVLDQITFTPNTNHSGIQVNPTADPGFLEDSATRLRDWLQLPCSLDRKALYIIDVWMDALHLLFVVIYHECCIIVNSNFSWNYYGKPYHICSIKVISLLFPLFFWLWSTLYLALSSRCWGR